MENKIFKANETDLCANRETWGKPIVILESSFIVIGNLFVLLVILRYPSKKFRSLNCFIIQLALADLCVGGIVFWIGFLSSKILSYVSLLNGVVVYGVLATSTSASTLTVLYIAVDRYIYILQHQKYKKIMTKPLIFALIGLSWLLPATVFIVIPISGWNCIESCDCSLYNRDMDLEYCLGAGCSHMMTPFKKETLLIGGICLLALLLASVLIYILLMFQVRMKTRQPVKFKQRKASEMRMIKTMVIILGGFCLTTGPLAFLCIVSFFHNVRELHLVMRIMVVISNVNSIMNPFFYFRRIPYMGRNWSKLWSSLFNWPKLRNCCCKKRANGRRCSAPDTIYAAASHQQNGGCVSESSVTMSGSKLQHLNKTIKLKSGDGNAIHTPWSSSDAVL